MYFLLRNTWLQVLLCGRYFSLMYFATQHLKFCYDCTSCVSPPFGKLFNGLSWKPMRSPFKTCPPWEKQCVSPVLAHVKKKEQVEISITEANQLKQMIQTFHPWCYLGDIGGSTFENGLLSFFFLKSNEK